METRIRLYVYVISNDVIYKSMHVLLFRRIISLIPQFIIIINYSMNFQKCINFASPLKDIVWMYI